MWNHFLRTTLLLWLPSIAAGAFATLEAKASSFDAAAYQEFRVKFGHRAGPDPVSFSERQALFESRRKAIAEHNRRGEFSWVAKVNKFADYTDTELQQLWGYRRVGGRWSSVVQAGGHLATSSLLEQGRHQNVDDLAEAVDWRRNASRSTGYIRDQGVCGSCWAVAAVGAIEMHAELQGHHAIPLSYEQLVDCVPNPRNCGGTGGCKGATAELAFKYVRDHGIVASDRYVGGYQHGGDGQTCKTSRRNTATISGWETLQFNKLQPMLETIAMKGPAVASVDASGWASYSSGVFDSCERDATVNHAILVVGYGVDNELEKPYWLIRNSWADEWGESGYIRLERHNSDEGVAGHCGTDFDPKQGVGCDGGSPTIPVCGMCGILSDTAYPKEVSVHQTGGRDAMKRIHSGVANIAVSGTGRLMAE